MSWGTDVTRRCDLASSLRYRLDVLSIGYAVKDQVVPNFPIEVTSIGGLHRNPQDLQYGFTRGWPGTHSPSDHSVLGAAHAKNSSDGTL